MRARGNVPLERTPWHRPAAMTAEEEFERAERSWFEFLIRDNVERIRYILGDGFDPGRERLFIGISENDACSFGPRSVGIAVIDVRPKFVDVVYTMRESETEYGTYRYTVSLDAAADIVSRYLGTRAALLFRRLGC